MHYSYFENGYYYYYKKWGSYVIECKEELIPEPPDPYEKTRSEHYFIEDIQDLDQYKDCLKLRHAKIVYVMAGDNYTWQDIINDCACDLAIHIGLYTHYPWPILHVKGSEPISKILTVCGVFNSGAAAKAAGWLKPIEKGYSEVRIGKGDKSRLFRIWYPQYPKYLFALD